MKNNQKINKLKEMKTILALVSATTVFASTGCIEGWKSDDHENVQSQVSSNYENIIEDVFTHNFTYNSAKAALEKKGLNWTEEKIKTYLEYYKEADPENNSEDNMYKKNKEYQESLKNSDVVEPSYEVAYTYTKNRKYYD